MVVNDLSPFVKVLPDADLRPFLELRSIRARAVKRFGDGVPLNAGFEAVVDAVGDVAVAESGASCSRGVFSEVGSIGALARARLV